jgi:hypothetical protein
MNHAFFRVATVAVIGVIVILWVRSSQEADRQNASRANVMRDWEQCSSRVKKRLVESDQKGSIDDLLKLLLSECQTQYQAYFEKVWEWREDALTETLKREIVKAKKFVLPGDWKKLGKPSSSKPPSNNSTELASLWMI